jgi:hypothetical protein
VVVVVTPVAPVAPVAPVVPVAPLTPVAPDEPVAPTLAQYSTVIVEPYGAESPGPTLWNTTALNFAFVHIAGGAWFSTTTKPAFLRSV